MRPEQDYPSTIIVPSNATPSYLNDETLNGALIGNIVAGDSREGFLGGSSGLVGALAGGAIGGALGKQRMENEYQNGRAISKPGSMGASIGVSAVVGGLITGLVAAVVATSGAGLLALGIAGAGAAVGGAFGYFKHKQAESNYEAAKAYYDQHGGQYEGREREAQKEKAYQVTPEEYALLKQKLAEGKPHAAQESQQVFIPGR